MQELGQDMVDRVYKAALPQMRENLEKLREGFSNLGPTKTDWTKLRIEPLLSHVNALEKLLHSEELSGEASRLRNGVVFFHSDLVYLRENINGLRKLLESEKKSLKK